MAIVTRKGDYKLADPNTALGAGETSVNSPLRSNLDYESAIADTAQTAGQGILERIEGAVEAGAGDIIEILTGQEDGDLDDLGTYVNGIKAQFDILQKLLDVLKLAFGGDAVDGATDVDELSSIIQLAMMPLGGLQQVATDVQSRLEALAQSILDNTNSGQHVISGDSDDWLFKVGTALGGLFGIAAAANTNGNPALANTIARLEALEANVNGGTRIYDPLQNRAALGSNWATIGAGLLRLVDSSYMSCNGSGVASGLYTASQTATDKQYLSVMIANLPPGGKSRIVINSDAAMTNYAALEIARGYGDNNFKICTGSGSNTVAPRTTQAQDVALSDVVGIGFDPATGIYRAYLNNAEITNWPDSGGIVTHGAGQRYVGATCNASNDTNIGPGFREFTAYDWTQ